MDETDFLLKHFKIKKFRSSDDKKSEKIFKVVNFPLVKRQDFWRKN